MTEFDEIKRERDVQERACDIGPCKDCDSFTRSACNVGVIDYLISRVETLEKALEGVRAVLNEELGDTDPDIPEDWTDEDIRREEPLFWAHVEIVKTEQALGEQP